MCTSLYQCVLAKRRRKQRVGIEQPEVENQGAWVCENELTG